MLGQDSLEQILNYYPEIVMKGSDGKEKTEYTNQYFIMYRESIDKPSMEKGKYVIMFQVKLNNNFTVSVRTYNSP